MSFEENYQSLLQKIYGLQNKGIKLSLTNVSQMAARLGNPHNNFRSVHIAGTNGKGSTAVMVEKVLRQAGYKTGVFTSPHLDVFNERIRVNGEPVADELAYNVATRVLASGAEDSLTFFEIVTIMAFCIFSEAKVDYAVLETGMGGRLDATNIVTPEVSVITNVSMEHTQWLGNTLAEIAFEKAGIIKPGVPVVTAAENEALAVVQRRALENCAPVSVLGRDFETRERIDLESFYPVFNYYAAKPSLNLTNEAEPSQPVLKNAELGLAGSHQVKNAACALRALEYLQAKGAKISADHMRKGLADTRWPGRLEILRDKPLVFLDGAHNLAGMRVLADFIRTHGLGGGLTLVMGVLADKDYTAMLNTILPLCKRVVFTRPANQRALNAGDLLNAAQNLGVECYAENDICKAIDFALDKVRKNESLCISGSLYLVGEAREILLKRNIRYL